MAQDTNIEEDLSELEQRLERLRILYEQYFMGIEKREPGVQRKDVERRIQRLRRVRFKSTAERFKFQTTVQRFNTLQQYWNRTCREIENGTYLRHIQRARRRLATVPPPDAPSDEAHERDESAGEVQAKTAADLNQMLDENVDLDAEMGNVLAALEKSGADDAGSPSDRPSRRTGLRQSMSPKPKGLTPLKKLGTSENPLAALKRTGDAKKVPIAPTPKATLENRAPQPAPLPNRPKAPPPRAGPPPAPSMRQKGTATGASRDALSDDRIRALHASYVEARKKTNASPVSFEKLQRNIRETEKKLREKHRGKQVDFDVGIKDGKAILKPRLK